MKEPTQIKREPQILWLVLTICIVAGTALVARNGLTSKGPPDEVKTALENSATAAANERASEKTVAESPATPALDFELKDLSGKSIKLSDYRGKVVLVNFWATWCGPCQFEIPVFVKMKRQYQNRGFEVVGISMDDGSQEEITEFVRQYEINYPVVMGADARLDGFGVISGLPTSFIIDRAGRIHGRHQGLLGLNEIEGEVARMLGTGRRTNKRAH